jgi:AhpC/TSA family
MQLCCLPPQKAIPPVFSVSSLPVNAFVIRANPAKNYNPPMGTFPTIGHPAPDFELPDSTRTLRRLSDLTAPGRLVLFFYRGSW